MLAEDREGLPKYKEDANLGRSLTCWLPIYVKEQLT